VLRFFKLTIANGLLGNCDAHLKYFSLLERPEGLRLAPAYDIVNTAAYHAQDYSTRFAVRIDGRYWQHDQLDAAVLGTLGRNLDLNDRTVDRAFDDLRKAVAAVSRRVLDRAWNERGSGFLAAYEQIVSSAITRILP
jgi:serine/threonine-protein kinase HipA